jgi:hypothetical protein
MSYLIHDRAMVSRYSSMELPDGTLLLLLDSPPEGLQLEGDPGPRPRTVRGTIGRSGWVICPLPEGGGVEVTMALQVGRLALGEDRHGGGGKRLLLRQRTLHIQAAACQQCRSHASAHRLVACGWLAAPQVDPAGSIPAAVVNTCNMVIPMHLDRIRRMVGRMDERGLQLCRDWYRSSRRPCS